MTVFKNVTLSKIAANPGDEAPSGLGLCTGVVWNDDFSSFNSDHWGTFNDVGGMTEFGADGWLKTGVDNFAELMQRTESYIEGAFDACVELRIDSTSGNDSNGQVGIRIREEVGHGSVAAFYLYPRTGGLFRPRVLSVPEIDDYHTSNFSPGTYYFRFTRDGSNNLYMFMWDDGNQRWEWDGDPAGAGPITTIDVNQVYFNLEWNDSATVWLKGSFKNVKLNSGTFNDV